MRLLSVKTNLAHCKLIKEIIIIIILKETIEKLKFLTFPRLFGKQCFAVVDAPFSNLMDTMHLQFIETVLNTSLSL